MPVVYVFMCVNVCVCNFAFASKPLTRCVTVWDVDVVTRAPNAPRLLLSNKYCLQFLQSYMYSIDLSVIIIPVL